MGAQLDSSIGGPIGVLSNGLASTGGSWRPAHGAATRSIATQSGAALSFAFSIFDAWPGSLFADAGIPWFASRDQQQVADFLTIELKWSWLRVCEKPCHPKCEKYRKACLKTQKWLQSNEYDPEDDEPWSKSLMNRSLYGFQRQRYLACCFKHRRAWVFIVPPSSGGGPGGGGGSPIQDGGGKTTPGGGGGGGEGPKPPRLPWPPGTVPGCPRTLAALKELAKKIRITKDPAIIPPRFGHKGDCYRLPQNGSPGGNQCCYDPKTGAIHVDDRAGTFDVFRDKLGHALFDAWMPHGYLAGPARYLAIQRCMRKMGVPSGVPGPTYPYSVVSAAFFYCKGKLAGFKYPK